VNIEEAAEVITQKIREDRLIHVFGTGGHSVMGGNGSILSGRGSSMYKSIISTWRISNVIVILILKE